MPLKLIVFVLADGWMLVASMLLKTFAVGESSRRKRAIVDMTHVIDWSREALRMALLLGGPLLAAALWSGSW